jgi:hypothetical protein
MPNPSKFAGYPLSSDYDSFELVLGRTTLGFLSCALDSFKLKFI